MYKLIILSIVFIFAFSMAVYGENDVKEFNFPSSLKGGFFEPSAVSSLGDRLIILNDKEENGKMYFYISDTDGNILDRKPIETDREIKDFEAITCLNEKVFYALLSHSYGDEKKRGLLKIAFNEDGYTVSPVPDSDKVLQKNIIYDSFSKIMNVNEINLEGLAYYKGKYNELLFLGMREPVFTNQTSVWRMNLKELEKGRVHSPSLWFTFKAETEKGGIESISSMEYYPSLKSMLILTSYESHRGIGGSLWMVKSENPEKYEVKIPEKPISHWDGVKPEGITCIKDKNGKEFIFIVFDNDEKETGIKGNFTIIPMEKIKACL